MHLNKHFCEIKKESIKFTVSIFERLSFYIKGDVHVLPSWLSFTGK